MPRRGGSGRAEEASGSGRRKRGRMETAATGAVTSTSAMDATYTEMFGMCSNAAAAVTAAAAAAASGNVANAYGAMSQTPMGLEVPMARMATYGYAPAGASVDRSGTGDGGVVFAPSPPPPVSTMNATATGQQQLNAMQAYANAYFIAQQWDSYFQQQAARNQAVADARMPTHVSNAGSMTFSPEVASEELRKRSRLVWTPALHARFVDAVQKLGEKTAVPKAIMKLMNVEGLTRENIASHLQKYRQHQKRLHDSSESTMAGMETTSLKGGKTRRKRKKDHQSHSGSGGEQGSGQGSRPSNEGQDSGSGARDENTRNVKVSSSEEEPVDPGTRRLPVAS